MSGKSFICGMRRFDKHRVSSHLPVKHRVSGNLSVKIITSPELERRLRQREAQNCALFGVPVTPTNSPILSSVVQPSPRPIPLLSL